MNSLKYNQQKENELLWMVREYEKELCKLYGVPERILKEMRKANYEKNKKRRSS